MRLSFYAEVTSAGRETLWGENGRKEISNVFPQTCDLGLPVLMQRKYFKILLFVTGIGLNNAICECERCLACVLVGRISFCTILSALTS